MNFKKLHEDTKCNCISNAIDDFQDEYVRKLRKELLTEKDFLSHWERNIGNNSKKCEEICSLKAVSINQYNKNTHFFMILSCLKFTSFY